MRYLKVLLDVIQKPKLAMLTFFSCLITTGVSAEWRPDPMPSAEELGSWSLVIGQSSNDGSPYAKVSTDADSSVMCMGTEAVPSLSIRCYEGEISAWIFIDDQCRFWDNLTDTTVEYTLDAGPSETAAFVADKTTTANGLWGTTSAQAFLEQLEAGTEITTRFIASLDENITATFNLTGAPTAFSAVRQACPAEAAPLEVEASEPNTEPQNGSGPQPMFDFENPTCGALNEATEKASAGGLAALPAMSEAMYYVGFASGYARSRGVDLNREDLELKSGTLCAGLPSDTPLETALDRAFEKLE